MKKEEKGNYFAEIEINKDSFNSLDVNTNVFITKIKADVFGNENWIRLIKSSIL